MVGVRVGKSARELSPRAEREGASPQTGPNHAAKKNLVWENAVSPYRKPTQVDEDECPKVLE